MPTKKRIGTADIRFGVLGIPRRLNRRGIIEGFRLLEEKIRYDGLSPRQRWVRRFDEDVTDLSELPIGLFEAKALILPRRHLPKTKEELHSLCRKLVHRGENHLYISIVLRGWPAGWSLQHHVDLLWSLRDRHPGFYEDVVRGRHGRALLRLSRLVEAGQLSAEEGSGLVIRQGLLWCAMDAQMVICGARASMIRPFGRLIQMTMKVFKAGTALRLMRSAITALETACAQYQTAEDEARDGKADPKPKGILAKRLWRAVEKMWPARGRSIEEDRADLDEGIAYIRGRLSELKARMPYYETYFANPSPHQEGANGKDNRLFHFHTIWHSGLSPAAGMAVALTRLVTAELFLSDIVREAAAKAQDRLPTGVQPLPPLSSDRGAWEAIQERVLDLVHAARLILLRDEDCLSRTRGTGRTVSGLVALDPDILLRDPYDKAGLTFVRDAAAFLADMGHRPIDAYVRRPDRDPRMLTYWRMDCAPEIRLMR